MSDTEFTVTDEHIELLQLLNIGWMDAEFGAPEVDPKRPYGNSNVVQDICEILCYDADDQSDVERAKRVHREMDTVLQIIVDTGRIETGPYRREDYGDWEPVESESDHDENEVVVNDMSDVQTELKHIEYSLDVVSAYLDDAGHTTASKWVATIADTVWECRRSLRRTEKRN
jgi:hypothetical protein